jgi:hypothetical protein
VKISYLLSSLFPYHKLICDDAGPAIATEYGWPCCTIDSDCALNSDVIVVDNRHHCSDELLKLSSFIDQSRNQLFLLRINDPFVFHRLDPWYKFCSERASHKKIHFLTPYQPTGLLSHWLSITSGLQYVYAPFTYDISRELHFPHTNRLKRIALSGNQRPDLYPLRYQLHLVSKFSVIRDYCRVSVLKHPGYPEKIQSPSHSIMHSSYLDWLSHFAIAFVDSTIYRIELLKYRELAYAGCAPLGDLPWALHDCPRSAFVEYKGPQDIFRLRPLLNDSSAAEVRAQSYRRFMRHTRCRSNWRIRVNNTICNLI